MYETKDENISVKVRFNDYRYPTVEELMYRGEWLKVTEQSLVTKAKQGGVLLWIFFVSTESIALKLKFDTLALKWYVIEETWNTEVDGI